MQQLCFSFSKGLIHILAFLVFVGCAEEKKPDVIMSEAEMVYALTEIYMHEEKIARLSLRRDSAEKIFELAKPAIFKKIGVNDSVFRESFDYYVDRPKQLEIIYSAVVDSLNLWEQKMSAPSEAKQ